MIIDGPVFEDLQDRVIEALKSAKISVDIAVAWININEYYDIFKMLLQNNVSIRLIFNNDVKNNRYKDKIDELRTFGLKCKAIGLNNGGFMHHKFCIVDNSLCLFGSFNWTKNAENNSIENLTITHDIRTIFEYRKEFESLMQLSDDDLQALRNPTKCESCDEPILYICVFEQDGDYYTKADVYEIYGSDNVRYVRSECFEVFVYLNLMGIFNKYSEIEEKCNLYGQPYDKATNDLQMEFEVSNFLSQIRGSRMGFPIIHAVGIYSIEQYYKDDYNNIIKILWKEKYMSKHINDIYYL